jgi:chemotaxis family two-component system response regulator Rcp1
VAEESDMSLDVLLVENSPGDVRLTQEAFGNYTSNVRLHVVTDGIEAMAFLHREGIHADVSRPDLILLDLNLPGLNGRDVLTQIKANPDLRAIPVIVLTTSDNEADILICYQLQANCYLRKPAHWDAFDNLVKSINAFWLTRAKLPQQSR